MWVHVICVHVLVLCKKKDKYDPSTFFFLTISIFAHLVQGRCITGASRGKNGRYAISTSLHHASNAPYNEFDMLCFVYFWFVFSITLNKSNALTNQKGSVDDPCVTMLRPWHANNVKAYNINTFTRTHTHTHTNAYEHGCRNIKLSTLFLFFWSIINFW